MKRAGRPNTMLIEMLIVLLFFSISAVIVLQLFVAAHDRNVRSDVSNTATVMAEDYAARFWASDLSAEAFFLEDGWTWDGQAYAKKAQSNGRTLRLDVQGGSQTLSAGTLEDWTFTVYDGERLVIALPMTRYISGEVGE